MLTFFHVVIFYLTVAKPVTSVNFEFWQCHVWCCRRIFQRSILGCAHWRNGWTFLRPTTTCFSKACFLNYKSSLLTRFLAPLADTICGPYCSFSPLLWNFGLLVLVT